MGSIGPLLLGPLFVVAAAELTPHSARIAQADPRKAAGGALPAGKANGQECAA
jgi:hypothetical protein